MHHSRPQPHHSRPQINCWYNFAYSATFWCSHGVPRTKGCHLCWPSPHRVPNTVLQLVHIMIYPAVPAPGRDWHPRQDPGVIVQSPSDSESKSLSDSESPLWYPTWAWVYFRVNSISESCSESPRYLDSWVPVTRFWDSLFAVTVAGGRTRLRLALHHQCYPKWLPRYKGAGKEWIKTPWPGGEALGPDRVS